MRSVLSVVAAFVFTAGYLHAPLFHLHELEETGHAVAGTLHAHTPESGYIPGSDAVEESHDGGNERPVDVIVAAAVPQAFPIADLNVSVSFIPIAAVSSGVPARTPVRAHDPPVLDRSNPRSPPA